jgi:MSHA biogenesis protein MshN
VLDRRTPVNASSSPAATAAVAPIQAAVKPANGASRADDSSTAKTISPRQDAEYRYQKALPLIQAGRIAEAQEMLQGALAADPSHGPARQLLAGILIDGKHGKEAEALLRAGLEKNPQQVSQAMMLARLQVDGGDLSGALSTLRQSLPHADNNTNYHALFAALLQRNGQHQEAVDQYTLALSKQPASAPWLVGLGISLQAQKRMAEAHEAFKRAKQSGTLGSDLSAFVDQRLKQTQTQREEGN